MIQAKFKGKSPIPLLGGARGGFIAYFFTLITKSENHFGFSIIHFYLMRHEIMNSLLMNRIISKTLGKSFAVFVLRLPVFNFLAGFR